MAKRFIALILCLTLIAGLIPSVSAAPIQKEPASRDRCCQTQRVNPLSPNYVRPDYDGKLIDITPQRVEDTFDYLNEHYVQNHPEQALMVYTGTAEDQEVLKTLAETITADCTTDKEKADAIDRWLYRNIYYDVNTSAYASDTFFRREGNCLSYANLMMFLLRALGIPAVIGDGWRSDMKTSTVDLFNMEGHAWCFVLLDGEWVLYDPLWIEGGTTDRDYMAEWIYFDTVETICPASDGDNLPPEAYDKPKAYYTDGKFYLWSEFHDNTIGTLTAFINNQAYAYVSNQCDGDIIDGWYYVDGRDKTTMERGELYRNGWASYGDYNANAAMILTYFFPNGMTADGYVVNFDGKERFMYASTSYEILTDDYVITDGLLTLEPGYSGPFLSPGWQENCVDRHDEYIITWESYTPDIVTVDQSGNIVCHQEGYAEIQVNMKRVEQDGSLTHMSGKILQIFVSDEERVPDYSDQEPCEHTYELNGSAGATCTGWGFDIYYCTLCGARAEVYTIEPLGHAYSIVETTPATCVSEGSATHACSRCGNSYAETLPVDPEGHVWDGGVCTLCGKVDPDWEAPAASGTCGENVTWTLMDDGTLTISGTGEMTSAPWRYDEYVDLEIKSVIIEEGVTSICTNAFRDYGSLTSVTFPAAIQALSVNAAQNSAELSDTLTSIGDYAFQNCDNLTEITLPARLRSIGASAFYGCTGLTDITFTGDAPTFGNICFWQVNATVWFPAGNETWTGDAFNHHGEDNITWAAYDSDAVAAKGGAWGGNITWNFDEASGTLTFMGTGDMEAADSLSYYPWYYFSDLVTSVVIGKGITNVPQYAFYTYSNLESVTLGSDVTVLEPLAFMECPSLTRIHLPEGLETIGHNCFSAAGLTELIIPTSVSRIGSSAFSETDLTSLTIPGNAVLEDGVFSLCFQLKTVQIQDGVTELPMMLFSGCSALETVYIPGSITLIDMGVFSGCDSLTSMYFTGDFLTCLDDWVFYDMTFTAYYPANNPTWTADKLQNYGGTITWVPYGEEEKDYSFSWYSGTTSLNGTIDLNIYAVVSEDLLNDPDAFVRFSYRDKIVDVPMSEALHAPTAEHPNLYRFSCPMYAKEVVEDVTVQMMLGDQVLSDPAKGEALEYGIVDYCMNRIQKSTNPAQVAMCKALLNYASAAQLALNYKTDTLANAGLSDEDKVLPEGIDVSSFKSSLTGSETGIKADSATLMYESEVSVRVYFALEEGYDIDDFTFTIDGEVVQPQQNDYGWFVETAGIPAKHMDQMFTFCVGGITVKYGPMSYVNNKLNASNTNTANLAKALYVYYQAAEALLG